MSMCRKGFRDLKTLIVPGYAQHQRYRYHYFTGWPSVRIARIVLVVSPLLLFASFSLFNTSSEFECGNYWAWIFIKKQKGTEHKRRFVCTGLFLYILHARDCNTRYSLWRWWWVWCGVVWCGVVWCGVVWYGNVISPGEAFSHEAISQGTQNSTDTSSKIQERGMGENK